MGQPFTEKDQEIYDGTSHGETFEVVLLNNCFSFPFMYGTLLTVETRGDCRPVLSYDWLDNIIKRTEDGMSLDQILEKN